MNHHVVLGTGTRIDIDERLLTALRRRDRTAAERLVARFGDRAYRLAIGITRNAADAEETVQDAFWSVIRKIDTFRGDSAFGSWVYRIVANAAYRRLRRRAGHRAEIPLEDALAEAPAAADWSATLEDPAAQTELRAELRAAIGELPPEYRAAVVLRDVEGLSVNEVAESLGISVAAAKSRTHRARLFLRRRLAAFASSIRGR
jgi:RNA polymerase sigma-70 factor (ECF subfamily)